MNYEHTTEALKAMLAISGRLEEWSSKLHKQSEDTQAAIRATREREEARFMQDILTMHEGQQRLSRPHCGQGSSGRGRWLRRWPAWVSCSLPASCSC